MADLHLLPVPRLRRRPPSASPLLRSSRSSPAGTQCVPCYFQSETLFLHHLLVLLPQVTMMLLRGDDLHLLTTILLLVPFRRLAILSP
jgi:hypothetical protein